MDIQTVKIDKPEAINFILGQSHFIKTVEDMHEALVSAVPGIKLDWRFAKPQVNVSSVGREPMMP